MGNIKKTVDELRPIDDTFMQKLSEDRGVCEELLQVVLERPHLQIISNQPQKEIHNIDTRSVRVDALCEDVDGSQFSVEVQKSDNDDHQKRVRYNGACVHVLSLEKSTKFEELPDIYMIYITETDIFKRKKTIYHIQRTIQETGEVIDNGYYEIYVNAEVDDGTTIAEYMQILKSSKVQDNAKFPNICNAVKYCKEGRGQDGMCEVVERYAREYAEEKLVEYAEEKAIETARALIQDGVNDVIIHNATKLSLEKVAELRERCSS